MEIQNCNTAEFSFPYFANRLFLLFKKKKFYKHEGSHWVGENVQQLIYDDSDHHLVKLLKKKSLNHKQSPLVTLT